jgi:DNA polymerase/3'-5' exonuclease PolX
MTKNPIILLQFDLLLQKALNDLYNSENKKDEQNNLFRISALRKIISIIKNYPTKIKNATELQDIKGIGKTTISRIDEILKNGSLKELENFKIETTNVNIINELEKIFGIGRKTAIDLVKNHNITSIQQLKKEANNLNLPDAIKTGIKYIDKYRPNIPRAEMLKLDLYIQKQLPKIDIDLYGIICGSYRRQQAFSNDIDLLIVHPKIKSINDLKKSYNDIKNHYLYKLINILMDSGFIKANLTGIDTMSKFMGYCKINKYYRRIDIRFMPYNSFYYALLYFTGSKTFNQKMRSIAMDLGYKLNEYGLFDLNTGKMIPADSEKVIFDKLNMKYQSPATR